MKLREQDVKIGYALMKGAVVNRTNSKGKELKYLEVDYLLGSAPKDKSYLCLYTEERATGILSKFTVSVPVALIMPNAVYTYEVLESTAGYVSYINDLIKMGEITNISADELRPALLRLRRLNSVKSFERSAILELEYAILGLEYIVHDHGELGRFHEFIERVLMKYKDIYVTMSEFGDRTFDECKRKVGFLPISDIDTIGFVDNYLTILLTRVPDGTEDIVRIRDIVVNKFNKYVEMVKSAKSA